MVAIRSLLLFAATTPFAAALPLTNSQSQTEYELISADLTKLDQAVLALNSDITSYDSGILQATPILGGVTEVHLANRKGYYDAMLISVQSAANSFKIVTQVNNTLAKDIPAAVKNLKTKREPLKAAGLTLTVLGSLKLLKSDHETFSAALAEKSAPESLAGVAYVVKVIDDSIKSGIAYFS